VLYDHDFKLEDIMTGAILRAGHAYSLGFNIGYCIVIVWYLHISLEMALCCMILISI